MKTLIAYYTAGIRDNRRYVPATWLNTLVIRPGRNFLEATKYRLAIRDGRIELGAVAIDAVHVGPTKSLGSLRAHVLLPDGQVGPEAAYEGGGVYRHPLTGQRIRNKQGELIFLPYSGREVQQLLTQRRAAQAAGEPTPPTPFDLDRAVRVLRRGDAIDIDHPLGRDMVNLRDVYFVNNPGTGPLTLPPFWVLLDEPPTPRQTWLDQQLLAVARGEIVLDIELFPFQSGKVLAVAEDDVTGDTGVLIGDPDGEGGELNLIIPRGAEVLVRPGDEPTAVQRFVRLLPQRRWGSANQVRGEQPALARYVEAALIDEATRVEHGLGTLYDVAMLDWPARKNLIQPE